MAISVTIRGHVVDVGAIVAAVRKHPAVYQAAVMLDREANADDPLVAYVVPAFEQRNDPQGSAAAIDAAHTAKWRKLSELSYSNLQPAARTSEPEPASSQIDFNLAGWKSSYTGQSIPESEMAEWVEQTVRSILRLRPRRVLEIGCGTGLLLFRIAPSCEEYRATDLSQHVADYVQKQIAADPRLAQAKVSQAEASDFSDVPEGSFDTVVLNSVIQYFPSPVYLTDVIAKSARALRPNGTVFVGDVPNLQLLEAFQLSVLLEQARDDDTAGELHARLRRRVESLPELAVAPAFFAALPSILPQIRQVILEPRRGRARNEMNRFRFNALLRTDAPQPTAQIPFQHWVQGGWTLDLLRETLKTERPDVLAFTGVPDARTVDAVATLNALREAGDNTTVQELRAAAGATAIPAVDPQDLWDLEETFPYDVQVGWSNPAASQPCSLDVLLQRRDARLGHSLNAVAGNKPIPWQQLASDPVRKRRIEALTSELDQILRSELPDFMVPSRIMIVDQIPQA